MTQSQHRLRIGDLIVSDGSGALVSDLGYTFEAHGDGFERGKVVSIDVAISTALQDGGRVFTESYGLREFKFFVVVSGDSVARAHAEADLAAVCGIRTEIGWRGPDAYAVESVWDVETSDMPELVEDDFMETKHGQVVYALRFTCQPFPRPDVMDVVPAVPVAPGVTPDTLTIDAGTATTRWTAFLGALSDQGAFLRISGSSSPQWRCTLAAPFNTSGHHYVSMDISSTAYPSLSVDGSTDAPLVTLTRVAGSTLPFRAAWLVEADSASVLDFRASGALDFTNLTASNVPPYFGTTKQMSRTIQVKGSARAQGQLSIAAPEGATLGTVLAYTATSDLGAAPSLRRNRVSGGLQSVSTGAISGLTEPINDGGTTFDIPVSEIRRGKHQLIARFFVNVSGSYRVDWTARAVIGGTPIGATESGFGTVTGVAPQFVTAVLGNVNLPPSDLPEESTAVIRVNIQSSSTVPRFDEGWTFNIDPRVGELTWVEAAGFRRLWIDTPTADRPNPGIFLSQSNDLADAFHAPSLIESWGDHQFFGATSALIVTADSDGSSAEFAYYPRYVNVVLDNE